MAPELLRFLVRFFLWSLGAYAGCWACGLLKLSIPSEVVGGLLTLLGLLLWYIAYFGVLLSGCLLVLYGVTNVLVVLSGKLFGAPQKHITDVAVYAELGKLLTRYKEKHYPDTPVKTVALDIESFEQSLNAKLPRAAHEQDSWWTDVSEHSQQWLKEGWQVTAVDLLAKEPKVMFSNILLSKSQYGQEALAME